jgi:hypothetical protein
MVHQNLGNIPGVAHCNREHCQPGEEQSTGMGTLRCSPDKLVVAGHMGHSAVLNMVLQIEGAHSRGLGFPDRHVDLVPALVQKQGLADTHHNHKFAVAQQEHTQHWHLAQRHSMNS